MKEEINYTKENIFTYNEKLKKLIGLIKIGSISLLIVLALIFILFLRDSNAYLIVFFKDIISNVYFEISRGTLIGSIYGSLFGGLFFIFLPIEVLFVNFLENNNPYLLITIYMIFLSTSYFINYFIGLKFGKIVKNMIGAEKFYETKGIVNKYGKIAIFVFNVLPFPSQQLSAILGVFKYNKTRFYTFFFLGQIVKYILMTIAILAFNIKIF